LTRARRGVYTPAYDDDPHPLAPPPCLDGTGMRSHVIVSVPLDEAPRHQL
jgi:hypothetical protein